MASSRIDRVFERRLASLINAGDSTLLQGGRRGVEKESLRVTPEGRIAYRNEGASFDAEEVARRLLALEGGAGARR
mgnify:CR=1 FL=1